VVDIGHLEQQPVQLGPNVGALILEAPDLTLEPLEVAHQRLIRVRIDPELLKPFAERIKTGVPGVGYVKVDASVQWPDWLKTRIDKGLPRLKPEDVH